MKGELLEQKSKICDICLVADSKGNRADNYVLLLPVIMWRADTVCRSNLEKRLQSAKRLVTNGLSLLWLARHYKKESTQEKTSWLAKQK